MKAFCFVVFCLTVCIALRAQEYFTRYQRFTQKEGYRVLESPNSITQDAKGLLWIGGDDGLLCFDGAHFQIFRHAAADSNSTPANHVAYNYQDKSGRYWAYVPDHGLYNFDPVTKFFRKFNGSNVQGFDINRYETQLPVETRSGKLWFIVQRYGLACWDAKMKKLTPYRLCGDGDCENYFGNGWLTTIAEDPNDETLWLGTNLGLLLHFSPATGLYESYKDPSETARPSPQRILFDKENIWIGTWGAGLKCFNRQTKTFQKFKWDAVSNGTRNICLGLARLNDSLFWVASADNGLMVFNLRQHGFTSVHGLTDNPLPQAINSFYQNKEGVIWLASQTSFVRINPAENFFSFHDLKPFLGKSASHGLYSFMKIGQMLYAGVYYGGPLLAYNTATKQGRTVFEKELTGIRCLAKDGGNNLWIATYNGLYVLNTATNRLQRFPLLQQAGDLATLRVNDMLFDGDSLLWIGAHQGLLKYNLAQGKVEWLVHHQAIALHTREWVLALHKDADGNIWFGTNNNGLGCFRRRFAQLFFFDSTRNKAYPSDQCNAITSTSDGRILFALGNRGLGELRQPFGKEEKMTFYNSENGLRNDRVESVFKDRENNYWLFTHGGICPFDAERMKVIRCFTKEDGLYETISYSHPYQDDEGLLYAGFFAGFQTFNADDFFETPSAEGGIYLSAVNVNGQALPNDSKKLRLRYDKTNLSFDFVFLTKTQSPDYVYAYKLSGVDDDWVYKGREASGQYSNLSPGKYTLYIKAMTVDGKWNSKEFLLPITVAPPWYGSVWFYTLLGLLTASTIVGVYRYRIAQIHRQNELRHDFNKKLNETEMRALRAQMNPHFIFNCLNSINRYIVKSDHKTASNYLTKFAKLIRHILDNSASDTITLDREIQTLQLYMDMEKLRFDEAFRYVVDVENDIDTESTFIPSMLIQPYVENAIWHGLLPKQNGESVLAIRFRKPAHDLLLVQIEDNGIGRKKAAELKPAEAVRKKSYGMQISKERIHLINELYNVKASVSVEDLEDGATALGTRVMLKIPLKPDSGEWSVVSSE